VADKCKYLLKIYIYGKKNRDLPSGAAVMASFSGSKAQ
jgi:hypothetical protein